MSGQLRVLLLAFALGFTTLLAATSRATTAIPKAPERWVTDTAGMLSSATRAKLDARLEAYEAKSGHQVVVWIGKTIGGDPLDVFAVATFKAWQLGRKGHDDGVLVLVLSSDRAIDIEVGYGLEDRLTDALAHRIIDEVMTPRLRGGDADGALEAGVDAILAGIEGRPVASEPAPVAQPVERVPKSELVLFGLLGLVFLVVLATHPSLAMYFLFSMFNGGSGFGGSGGGGGGGGGFSGGGGRSGGGGARGRW